MADEPTDRQRFPWCEACQCIHKAPGTNWERLYQRIRYLLIAHGVLRKLPLWRWMRRVRLKAIGGGL
jgi:hypothetical protein